MLTLGRVVATRPALAAAERAGIDIKALIARHQAGDWGDLTPGDEAANRVALRDGERVFSSYQTGSVRLWIITESDRSYTTVMLPDDY